MSNSFDRDFECFTICRFKDDGSGKDTVYWKEFDNSNKGLLANQEILTQGYRFRDFEMVPIFNVFDRSWFHKKNSKRYLQGPAPESYDECIWSFTTYGYTNPRIRRDLVLAWSIRRDFYKYHLKFEASDFKIIFKYLNFLQKLLPLEENIFFLLDDGFYICNPVSDENLIKIEDFFGKENVFINNHELYFNLDKNLYEPRIPVTINHKKVFKFTYLFILLDFSLILKDYNWQPIEIISIENTMKDPTFFKCKEDEMSIETESRRTIGLETYRAFIQKEWARIPIWFQEYVTPEMINLEEPEY